MLIIYSGNNALGTLDVGKEQQSHYEYRSSNCEKNGDIKQHFKECPDLRLQTASHEHMNGQRIFISNWDHFYGDI